MGASSWFFRGLPALATIAFLVLFLAGSTRSILYMIESFFGFHVAIGLRGNSNVASAASAICALFELLLSLYLVALHVLAMGFPFRACWSVVIMTWEVACARVWCEQRRKNLMAAEGAVSGVDFFIQAILIPNYKEDLSTLQDTLDVLAASKQAKSTFDIWLAQEEKDPNAKSSAATLEGMYQNAFRSIQSTFHPAGLPGEVQGKSSNVSWAARQATDHYEHDMLERKVIFTVIDADSNLSPDYFLLMSEMHASSQPEDRDISMYVPPIVFDRNAHKVPVFVRIADMAWSAASLSGTYPGSSVCIPTSVYSVPLTLARSVGGWDVGADAIGEDMHMYLKCFFHTRADLITRPVPSPASHCNVSSSKLGLNGYVDGMMSRSRQALRHMWGSLDTGYAYGRAPSIFRDNQGRPFDFKKFRRVALLYSRLFEAHCLPSQFTLSIIASTLFAMFIPTIITPAPMLMAFSVCSVMRPISLVIMLVYFALYRRYHSLCLKIRKDDCFAAELGEGGSFSNGTASWWYYLENCLFPVAGMIYGTLPALFAQFSHLFTDRLDYTVSLKPMREMARRSLP